MTDWRLKIFAYLHDPPDKPLALGRPGGHAAWGRELASMLGAEPGEGERGRWDGLVARADRLAAGADRTALLVSGPVTVEELRHPLSGHPVDLGEVGLDLRDPALAEGAAQALREEVGRIREATAADPQATFLALWGLLPERLRARRQGDRRELRGAWDLLPAETRMPNHPVSAHEALVSALATVLAEGDRAALLAVTVGPVQRFIAQARRTSDLWAGSVLLAQALLAGIRPIVEELGPDHVVFPVLRSSRAFLAWLLGDSPWGQQLRGLRPPGTEWPRGRSGGGLPNRFVAIVPAGWAPALAERCEAAVGAWWQEAVRGHGEWLERQAPDLAGYAAMASAQATGHLRVTWAVSPWPLVDRLEDGAAAGAEAAWLRGGVLPDTLARYLAVLHRVREAGSGPRPFAPNGGLLYAACYDGVERLVGAAKLTPRIVPRDEGGLKCSLCGERAVVPSGRPDGRLGDQRRLWAGVREALDSRRPGLVRGGEALCGVCWAKRRFGTEESQEGIPSTAEIAASPFKRAILDRLAAGDAPPDFVQAVRGLCDAVERAGRFGDAFVVPALRRYKEAGDLQGRFARIEGELLLAHPREDREPDDRPMPPDLVRAAAGLRKVARKNGIAPPRPYLAVLVLDGDEMGKWLSGAMALPLGAYLTDRAKADLQQLLPGELLGLLQASWPMTPALHAAFSEACGVFSQRTARRTVESADALGVLVYAGGDDVLALLPAGFDATKGLEYATETARRLRFRFSGHVKRVGDGDGDEVAPDHPAGFVLDRYGLGLALGGQVTASAGIAVFHQRWPLGRALEAAREAEEYAKEALGRDALGLTILRRSGQATVTGLGFRQRPGDLPELLQLASPIARAAAERHAEGDWPDAGARLAALARASARREAGRGDGDVPGPGPSAPADDDPVATFRGVVEAFREGGPLSPRLVSELGARLAPLAAEAARDGTSTGSGEMREAGRHLSRWLALIEAAAFLGRGGEA